MLNEKSYYSKFKQQIESENSLLAYFAHLNLEDWVDFFDDYYTQQTARLVKIIAPPKGEDVYSYGLILLEDVDSSTKKLIAKANNSLLSNYLNESKWDLVSELFNTVRYLELNISSNILIDIVSNESIKEEVREHAAITLSIVHENTLTPFWDSLDLKKDNFLIPSYLSFFEKINPIKGLSKLLLLTDEPKDIESYETPILYSLLQVGNSLSDIEKYQELKTKFPDWTKKFTDSLFEDYPELDSLREKIQRPYEDILPKIQLDYSVWDDLESENMSIEFKNSVGVLKSSFNILLKELRDKPELIEVVNQKEVTIIDPSYIQQLDSIFISLKTELKRMGIGNINDPNNEQVFEATENIFLYDQPVIFLYPYFLDDYRMNKRGAGVIQYADQKSISMVIHKHNQLYYKWDALRDEAKEELRRDGEGGRIENTALDRSIPQQKSESWLVELIQHLYSQNGKIYSIRGYVFDSLIQQFAKKWIPTNENKKMIEVLRNSTDIGNIDKELPFYRKHGAKETVNKNEILLLDPADALKKSKNGLSKELSELNTDYYDVITVQHGLNISVGIGFSLFALPRLLKNKNWKTLQDLVVEKLQPEKDLLMSVGIRVFDLETKTVNKQNKVIA